MFLGAFDLVLCVSDIDMDVRRRERYVVVFFQEADRKVAFLMGQCFAGGTFLLDSRSFPIFSETALPRTFVFSRVSALHVSHAS